MSDVSDATDASGSSDVSIRCDLQGTIVGVFVGPGDRVVTGQVVALVESMKMHHDVVAPCDGVVGAVLVGTGDTVAAGDAIGHVDTVDAAEGVVAVDALRTDGTVHGANE